MKSKPRRLRQLMEHSAESSLLHQVSLQSKLLDLVRKNLPSDQAAHCTHARLNGSLFLVYADSPAWASKLRFTTTNLLSALRKDLPGIANIRVKTAPPVNLTRDRARKAAILSSLNASQTLLDSAKGLDDQALSEAIGRLATTLRQRQSTD